MQSKMRISLLEKTLAERRKMLEKMEMAMTEIVEKRIEELEIRKKAKM